MKKIDVIMCSSKDVAEENLQAARLMLQFYEDKILQIRFIDNNGRASFTQKLAIRRMRISFLRLFYGPFTCME